MTSTLGSGDNLPADLRHHSVLLEQTSRPESLLRHLIINACTVGLTEDRLRAIAGTIKAPLVKMGEKTVGRRSLIWSIILVVFDELDEDAKLKLLLGIVGESKTKPLVPDDIARQALQAMPSEEMGDFSALKERLDKKLLEERYKDEVKRQVGDRAAIEHATPACIKALRPEWKGAVLCLDYGKGAFEAYYPAGKPTKSVAMTYESSRSGVEPANSKLAALTYCVEYLWKNHSDKGRETSPEFIRRKCYVFGCVFSCLGLMIFTCVGFSGIQKNNIGGCIFLRN